LNGNPPKSVVVKSGIDLKTLVIRPSQAGSGNKKKVKAVKKTKSARSARRGMTDKDAAIMLYAESLARPFTSVGPSLGFNHWSQNITQCSPYLRSTGVTGTSSGFFVVNPDACLSGIAGSTSVSILNSFVCLNAGVTNENTAWGTANTSFQCLNGTVLRTLGRAIRLKSCGMRLLIGSPLTSTPGVVSATRLPGVSYATDVDSYTYNSFSNLPSTRIYIQQAGIADVSLVWAPVDYSDMEFNDKTADFTSYWNQAGLYQPLLIAFSGVPVGSRWMLEVCCNIEIEYGAGVAATAITSAASDPFTIAQVVPSLDNLMSNALPKLDLNPQFSMTESYSDHGPPIPSDYAKRLSGLMMDASLLASGAGHLIGSVGGAYKSVRDAKLIQT